MPCCGGSGVANDKFSTLPDACYHGNLEKVKELMKKGNVDVNKPDADGKTPLHRAAQSGSVDVMSFLLDNKADASKRSKSGETPLHVAVFHRNSKAVELLLKKSENARDAVNAVDDVMQMTALHIGIKNGSADIVKTLLDHGADAAIEDASGQNALSLAQFWHQQAQAGLASPKAEHGKVLDFVQAAAH